MIPEDQVIRYAHLDGCDVAWSSVGAGPPLVIGGWWSGHLVHDWTFPEYRYLVGRLADHFTVIRYDPPGLGLSQGPVVPTSVEAQRDALAAVVDAAAGDARVSLFAGSSGCPVVVAYAAEASDRVERLVLYGGYLRGADVAAPSDRRMMTELVRRNWGISSRLLTDVFLPDATATQREEAARRQRRIASADEAASALTTVYSLDGTAWASRVSVPTLVLHRRGDRAIRFGLGRELAARIPGAVFEPLEGAAHFPWHGDADEVADRVLRFLGVDVPTAPTARLDSVTPLTAREREVMALVADGLTDAQIAARLQLSPHTVHRHIANVRTKLGVASRAAAAARVVAGET